MPSNISRLAIPFAILAISFLSTDIHSHAQETVLHSFNFGNGAGDGYSPLSSVVLDAAGNLYGTTNGGGTNGGGTVYELSPGDGVWTEQILHSFGSGKDGASPQAGVIFDSAGNLYGVTPFGGSHGVGAIFTLSPAKGTWKEKVLRSFQDNNTDGQSPEGGLVINGAGNLYGTTYVGGTGTNCFGGGCGIVFEMMAEPGGKWKYRILHDFSTNPVDGELPIRSMIFDGSGNLYGTTWKGGSYGGGAVFELTPTVSGKVPEEVLYNFDPDPPDFYYPEGPLVFDTAGNLYGTATTGGANGCGAVFELSPFEHGLWTESTLYSFNDENDDGCLPVGSMVFDQSGNLYGITANGGATSGPSCCGTIFELTPTGGGSWSETVAYRFLNNGMDGTSPVGGLVIDPSGNLYGATGAGGLFNYGTVFEFTPN